MIRIFVGREADGKRRYFNKTIRGSKKDAQKYLTAKLREKDLGQFVEPASMSLNTYLDKWLEEVAWIKVRQVTFDGYEAKLKVHVRSSIGQKRLCDLQAYDIQKLYNGMIRKGLSAKTVRHVHNVLSPALKQAVKWKLINQNPCELCELPKVVKKEMQCFTPDEVSIFLEHAKSDRYYSALVLAIETGMRPEEYLGLKWKDIDFEHSRLSVRRALVVLKGGGFTFTEPKTAKSRRSIPL
jgi:integrase